MATDTTKAAPKAAAAPKLPEEVFAVEVNNHELLKLAYDAYLANNRTSAARTKTRGEVSGGGKKPWKQKGTGRARFGSTRNPIWRGGGIVFGPRGTKTTARKFQHRQSARLSSRLLRSLKKQVRFTLLTLKLPVKQLKLRNSSPTTSLTVKLLSL